LPAKFNKCVGDGGRVRTISLPKNKYMTVCFPKGGGSSIKGEVHKKKGK
jgi:hypothetical protein